jgi:hypothetical protein
MPALNSQITQRATSNGSPTDIDRPDAAELSGHQTLAFQPSKRDPRLIHDGVLYTQKTSDGNWEVRWQAIKPQDFVNSDVKLGTSATNLSPEQLGKQYAEKLTTDDLKLKTIPLSMAYGQTDAGFTSQVYSVQRPLGEIDKNGNVVTDKKTGKPLTYTESHHFQIRVARQANGTMTVYALIPSAGGAIRKYPISEAELKSFGVQHTHNGGLDTYPQPTPQASGDIYGAVEKRVAIGLEKLHAKGMITVDGKAADIQKENAETLEKLRILFDVITVVIPSAKFVGKSISTVLNLRKLQLARVLTVAESKALKAAEARIVVMIAGGTTGLSGWILFVDEKGFDQTMKLLATGKTDNLSKDAKGLVQLLNWTLGGASISTFVSDKAKDITAWSAAEGLKTGRKAWMSFVDPRCWTTAKATASGVSPAVLEKYKGVLDWIGNNLDEVVDANSKLNVPSQVIRNLNLPVMAKIPKAGAGATAVEIAAEKASLNAALADSMSGDGMWKLLTSKPLLGTFFVTASMGNKAATFGAYTRLMVGRASLSAPANVLIQNMGSLLMNGSLSINWIQLGAAMVGSSIRSMGTPGAWEASTISGKVLQYGASSVAAFFTQWGIKAVTNGMVKSKNGLEVKTLQIIGNVNQAANAMFVYATQLAASKNASPATVKLVDAYAAQLKGLLTELQSDKTNDKRAQEKAKALDAWLDTAENGSTRRKLLNSIPLEVTGLEQKQLLEQVRVANQLPGGTLQNLGIAPQFDRYMDPKASKE